MQSVQDDTAIFSTRDLHRLKNLLPADTPATTTPAAGTIMGIDYWTAGMKAHDLPPELLRVDCGSDAAHGYAALNAGFHLAFDMTNPAFKRLEKLSHRLNLTCVAGHDPIKIR